MNQKSNISQAHGSFDLQSLVEEFTHEYDNQEIPSLALSFSVMLGEIESLYSNDCTDLSKEIRKPAQISLINIASILLCKIDSYISNLNESKLNNEDTQDIQIITHDLTCALTVLKKTTLVDYLASSFAHGLYKVSQDLIQIINSIPDLLKAINQAKGNE